MIKINKGGCPPGLAEKGAELTKKLCDDFDLNKAAYQSGEKKFEFDSKVYGSREVREALWVAQHGKCCFSEAKFLLDYPPVEHFRPKGGFLPHKTASLAYPGYYWLAYEWGNLLLSKPVPNTSYKRTLFPLVDESKRNRNHHENHFEEAFLIHPGEEDPREHIRFEGSAIKGETERGWKTIKILGLDVRPDLQSKREEHLEILKRAYGTIQILLNPERPFNDPKVDELFENLVNHLLKACEPKSEFSSMAIDFVLSDNLLTSILHNPQPPGASPAQPESPPSAQP